MTTFCYISFSFILVIGYVRHTKLDNSLVVTFVVRLTSLTIFGLDLIRNRRPTCNNTEMSCIEIAKYWPNGARYIWDVERLLKWE